MGIETDLNVEPYYDDANNALDSNYHRILFRPSVAIQARELTQLQDILQNQIERFGDNIYVAGTIIKGCNFNFDSNYYYAKILDLRPIDSQPANPSQYVNLLAHEATSNLYAICVNYQDGFESQDPDLKTLYFKYINSGINNEQQFSSGSTLQFFSNTDPDYAEVSNTTNYFVDGDVTIASVTNAVGTGYSMSVSSGVIFQKGHFIQVANNTSVIVSKYSSFPDNTVVGFMIDENIVTEYQDTTLYDKAAGSSNFNAPGAHRLQLIPTLTAFDINSVPEENFLSLVEWESGNITKSFQQTQYSELGNELARRTYEESGNYFIRPFRLHMENANDTHNYAVTSAGLAYIEGHRVEQLNNIRTPVRKGTDVKTVRNQIISTNFNNSILVKEFVGNFPSNIIANVSLRSAAGSKITNNSFGSISPAGVEIGTAKVISVVYESGTIGTDSCVYRLYLSDVTMNPGKSFRSVKGIYYAGSPAGFADVILTYDSTTSSNVAKLEEPSKSCLVFKTSKTGLASLSNTGTLPDYVYRTVANSQINNNGNSNIIQLTGSNKYLYGQGVVSTTQENDVVVIPTSFSSGANSANVTLAKTGNVTITSGNNKVQAAAGNTTLFTSEYQIGDYICIANTPKRIVSISNSSYMLVDSAWLTSTSGTHNKCYPRNVPINFSDRQSTINIIDSNSQQMVLSLLASNGASETLTSNANISVYTNVLVPNDPDRGLQINNSISVRLNLANNAGGVNGPWCLGVPYGYRLRNVYKSSNTGAFQANTTSGNLYLTTNTSGFSNGVSLFGYGIPNGTTANVANSTALLMSAAATATTTNGQFTYAYYSTSESDDFTKAFVLDDGQKDAFFDQSFLVKNPDYNQSFGVDSTTLLTVVFDVFKPINTGKGYISIDSYRTLIDTTTDLDYETIPSYTSSSGTTYQLRDSIDFRPFVNTTANILASTSTATINPRYTSVLPNTENYVVAPNQTFIYDTRYYIGRIDKLMLNSYGAYSVVEGTPSERPKEPADKTDAMTLATINIPPIPSLAETILNTNTATNYLVSLTTANQNRVYTMKDISSLDNRIKNVEYYTSLSLLEQQTSSLTISSSITGANRFKNGIFVDNFSTTDSLDVTNTEFRAALSPSETALVPRTVTTKIPLRYDSGSNTIIKGNYVVLDNSSELVPIITQKFGSNTRNCTDTFYSYVGSINLAPNYVELPELNTADPVNVDTKYISGQLECIIYAYSGGSPYKKFEGYTGAQNNTRPIFIFRNWAESTVTGILNSKLGAGLTSNEWKLVESGYFIPPETGVYTWTMAHDDDIVFKIGNDTFSVPDWDYGTPSVFTTSVSLTKGQYYLFSYSLYANGKGKTHSDFKFSVNGNEYAFSSSAFYGGSTKPIFNNMFARIAKPQVTGTPLNTIINNDASLTTPYVDYDNNIEFDYDGSATAPSVTTTQPNQITPILSDYTGQVTTKLNLIKNSFGFNGGSL